jgi:beta-glucuronidase
LISSLRTTLRLAAAVAAVVGLLAAVTVEVAAGSAGSGGSAAPAQAGPTGPSGATGPTAPPPSYGPTVPSTQVQYTEGQSGRFLMDGPWLFRFDNGNGVGSGFATTSSIAGWQMTTVPYAWNVGNNSVASFDGAVGWYRKDFRLPSAAAGLSWIVRFESVNYVADVWINGHRLGQHEGSFLPFEYLLPAHYLSRTGTNRLVLRVDSHHFSDSLPPNNGQGGGTPSGGWWNYGGILREVYLREVSRVDFTNVQVLPKLRCASCAARVQYTALVTNYDAQRQTVSVSATYGGQPSSLGTKSIAPGQSATFTGSVVVGHPRLWGPGHPTLYPVQLTASVGGTALAHDSLQSGIRLVQVIGGHLYLNGEPLHLRGVGIQEDSLTSGFAIDEAQRAAIVNSARDLGADFIRSQYPLSPYEEELADQDGIVLWSEVPVFSVRETVLRSGAFRAKALAMLRQNITDNGSHPSIAIWSIANELSSRPGSGQTAYINSAVALAHQLDPTRPVGLALAGYPSVSCQPAYAPLQVIGINDYFGWYPGPGGQISDRTLLPAYLDAEEHCYHRQALMVTEFGAEADRDGPVQERGTFEFQSDFVQYHLGVFATKPYLSGATYWALQDFRVTPGWTGENPQPDPPVFHKGLLDLAGNEKPAYSIVQQMFRATRQVG